jgi:hypothetical protein
LLQGFLGITYPLILLQRRISLQMVVLLTSFVYFLEFSKYNTFPFTWCHVAYSLLLIFFTNNYINDSIK